MKTIQTDDAPPLATPSDLRMTSRTLKTLTLRFVLLLGAMVSALALAWSR